MANGIVKWFNNTKGFGFLDAGDGEGDVFVHYTAIAMDGFKTLPQGGVVSYELVQGPRGRHAQDIRLLSRPDKPRGSEEARSSNRVRTPQFRANQLALRPARAY